MRNRLHGAAVKDHPFASQVPGTCPGCPHKPVVAGHHQAQRFLHEHLVRQVIRCRDPDQGDVEASLTQAVMELVIG